MVRINARCPPKWVGPEEVAVVDSPIPMRLPVLPETVLDTLRSFVAVLSTEGRIQYLNAQVLRSSGDDPESVLGRQFSALRWWTHMPGASVEVEQAVREARLGRKSRIELEAQITHSQRIVIDFEMRPTYDSLGAPIGIVVEGQDITEQRAMERKLRDAHFRWRTIADFTVDWEFWLHPNGYFLYVSPSCQRVSGYTPDDFMQGRVSLASIAHPQDRTRVLDLLTNAFSGSTDHHHTWRISRRDGGIRWVSMSWQSVHDEDGKFMGVRGSLRDVTELVKTEEELKRSVEAYRTLARHFPKGIVALLDRDLRLVVCDGPAFDSLPVEPARLVGRHLNDVLDREMLTQLDSLINTATSGSEVADVVRVGDSSWLVHLTPIRDPQDRVAHIIASAVESPNPWSDIADERPTVPGP